MNWRPRSAAQFPCLSSGCGLLRILAVSPDNLRARRHCLRSWRRWAPSASRVLKSGPRKGNNRENRVLCSSLFPQKQDGLLEVTVLKSRVQLQQLTGEIDRDRYREHTQSKLFFWNRFWLQGQSVRQPQFSQRPVELMYIGSNKKLAARYVFGNKIVKQSPQMRP